MRFEQKEHSEQIKTLKRFHKCLNRDIFHYSIAEDIFIDIENINKYGQDYAACFRRNHFVVNEKTLQVNQRRAILFSIEFVNHDIPKSFSELFPYLDLTYELTVIGFGVAAFCTVLLFVSALLQRKKPIRDYYNLLPFIVRIIGLVGLTIIIVLFGVQASWGKGGFLYANF